MAGVLVELHAVSFSSFFVCLFAGFYCIVLANIKYWSKAINFILFCFVFHTQKSKSNGRNNNTYTECLSVNKAPFPKAFLHCSSTVFFDASFLFFGFGICFTRFVLSIYCLRPPGFLYFCQQNCCVYIHIRTHTHTHNYYSRKKAPNLRHAYWKRARNELSITKAERGYKHKINKEIAAGY